MYPLTLEGYKFGFNRNDHGRKLMVPVSHAASPTLTLTESPSASAAPLTWYRHFIVPRSASCHAHAPATVGQRWPERRQSLHATHDQTAQHKGAVDATPYNKVTNLVNNQPVDTPHIHIDAPFT